MSPGKSAVRLEGVAKSFDGHAALKSLDLDVPSGSVYGFIGPNGSGKTTTLRIIMHILLADRGRVEVLGSPAARAANDRIGYLPEERGLYRKMGARRLLRYFAALKGVPSERAKRETDAWLERLGLAEWAEKPVEALSKGMSQKLQFIGAVISRPELIILDEPFSGLDPVNMEVLRDAVLKLRDDGATVILSTHDMGLAEAMCDFICMIHRGRKVLDGTMADIQARYGADTVRLKLENGAGALKDYAGIESVRDLGQSQEVRLSGDPQSLLGHLSARTKVRHFEIIHPSLHDIFIRIARGDDA